MLSFIKRRKFLVGGIAAAVVLLFVAIGAAGNGGYDTVSLRTGDLVRTVRVSGKVAPEKSANLGFEIGGTVSRVYKDVGESVSAGESLVSLDQARLYADLQKARADLASAEAELAKVSNTASSQTKTDTAKLSLIQAVVDAYTQSDDAIHAKTDQFFTDPRTQNPKITFAFDDYQLYISINKDRIMIEEALDAWEALVARMVAPGYVYSDADLATAKSYAGKISSFLTDVARAVNDFEANSVITQTMIDKYRTDTAAARQNVNAASASLISESDKVRESVSDVPVQAARVAAARATVANYESQLGNAVLRSPITGVVSKQDAKEGEAITAGSVLVSVITRAYVVEAYVPEVSIAGIKLGDTAKVTMDAYGSSESFGATVSHIDPAETIRDGVSTYKVKLSFASIDPRIRPGMTSNIEIETMRKPGVTLIPERAVIRKDGQAHVYVLAGDEREKREVILGDKDSTGNVELVSGLAPTDTVLLNPAE